jgi:hypothetical protein
MAWEALKAAFTGLLRAQREGRPIEELALYLAELTTPHGLALAQAIHAAKLGPDPALLLDPERKRVSVGMLTAEEMVSAATHAGPLLKQAAVELRFVPPTRHIRVLFAAEETRVAHLHELVFSLPTRGGEA